MTFQSRYVVYFEFLGTEFYGSQIQPEKRTVQGELQKAIRTLTKDKTNLIFSGRTDAKVSAYYQVAHFDSDYVIEDFDKFSYSLNCILPDDIKVFDLNKAQPGFHAQKSAKFKHYRYIIQNDHVASVFEKNNLFFPFCKLNIERINNALKYLIGYHDFSAFKSVSDNPYNDCEIYFAKAKKIEKNRKTFIFIDIIGNRFLYNMVRTIVGQILFMERNDLEPQLMQEVLLSKDRSKAASVVSAAGLFLKYVGYEDVDGYIKKIIS